MIAQLIRWSANNRLLVLLATLMVVAWGVFAMLRTPLDAIPDLSDTQVIIRTQWAGQAPGPQMSALPRRGESGSSHRFRFQIAVKHFNLCQLTRKIEAAAKDEIDRCRNR